MGHKKEKKRDKKRSPKQHLNFHHILPRSRLNGKGIVSSGTDGVSYFKLFPKMTPPEIIGWLNRNFWGSEYKIKIRENPEPLVIKPPHIDLCYRIQQSRLNSKTVIVPIEKHKLYHYTFSNMTPSEIVDWLNRKYWGNKYEINIREKII